MPYIITTNGVYVYVDEEDYDYINQWNWQYHKTGHSASIERCESFCAKQHLVYMSNEIAERMGLDTNLSIDHIDRDPTNNRRNNLRESTRSQQNCNRCKQKNNRSNFIGVRYKKSLKRWVAYISNDKSGHQHIGCFDTKEEAAKARDLYAVWLHKEFVVLNFPELKEKYQQILKEIGIK